MMNKEATTLPRLHIVCLTKSYRKDDFDCWYRWYASNSDYIHVIDNESTVDIRSSITRPTDTYQRLEGWPNKWKLFDEILKANRYDFLDGDYVFFADDDDFLWYDDCAHGSLIESIESEFNQTQLDQLLVPTIYMSTKKLTKNRNTPYVNTHFYRRNDYSSRGKVVLRYFIENKYSFSKKDSEPGNIPFYKNASQKQWMRYSKVVGGTNSKCTYGDVDYCAGLRLYNFNIKSLEDWNIKCCRGNPCDKSVVYGGVKDSALYGNYDVIDNSVAQIYMDNFRTAS